MDAYLPLQKIFYRNTSDARGSAIKNEAKRRLEEASCYRTGIEIASGELFLAMPKQLSTLSERLLRVERKISRLWNDLPGIARWAYFRGLIMDEIVSTNEIEGVHSTRRQIQEALESVENKKAAPKNKRFREFAQLYLELTNNNHVYPKTPADIRKIYDAVVAGELADEDQLDGTLFRKDAVDVLSPSQKAIHVGVTPETKIISMLEQMLELVNSAEIPPTYSAIIAHFLFEYIHPFYDGNGRTGRYLLALYLSEPLSLPTVLSLSTVIAENKGAYYKAFKTTEDPLNHAEATFFVIQIMEFVRLAQDSLMDNLRHKTRELDLASASLGALSKKSYNLSKKEIDVVFQIAQSYLFGDFSEVLLDEIARDAEISIQTARKYTLKFEDLGLLETVSKKPLVFTLTEKALKLLSLKAQT